MKQILILLLITVLLSCGSMVEDDTACVEYRMAAILETTLPDQGILNQPIELDVKYAVTNGCGFFHEFKESMVGDTLNVEIEAVYKGCICTQDIPVYDQPFTYVPKYLGLNYIRFNSTFNQSFLETIEVF